MSTWNGNRFSVYKSDEKQVLGLLEELGNQVNDNTDNKTDKLGDHAGTWQGISKPTLSNEGLAGTVELHTDQLNNLVMSPILIGEVGVVYKHFPYGDVRRYGAKGDGITDDTNAINNAITSVSVLGGGLVKIPVPTVSFYCANDIVLKSNVTIQGSNRGNCIFDFKNVAHKMTNTLPVSNVAIEKIKIQNCLGFGLHVNGTFDTPSDNIMIDNVMVENTSSAGITVENCTNATITRCLARNCRDNGIYSTWSKNVLIDGNISENSGGSGGIVVGYNDNDTRENIVVSNNIVKSDNNPNSLETGIYVVMATNVIVSGNLISDGKSGIAVDEWTSKNVLIIANQVNGMKSINPKEYGIRVGIKTEVMPVKVEELSIIGNNIVGYQEGIHIENSWSPVIKDNVIRKTLRDGIKIDKCYGVTIKGNTFRHIGTQNTWNTASCILVQNCAEVKVLQNTFENNLFGGYCHYETTTTGTVSSDGTLIKLYVEGVTVATINGANIMTLGQLKTAIEAISGWKFIHPFPSDTLLVNLRRTGPRNLDWNNGYVATVTTPMWLGETEPYYNIRIKATKNYYVKNNDDVSKIANVKLNVETSTELIPI